MVTDITPTAGTWRCIHCPTPISYGYDARDGHIVLTHATPRLEYSRYISDSLISQARDPEGALNVEYLLPCEAAHAAG